VVRGGVEPPTFRFSGGFARPGKSTADHLTGLDAVQALPSVQDQPHVSIAVVSKVLARAVNVHQMVVDLMSIATDDLDRSKEAELGMVDLGISRCHGSGRSP
jgi:hypothetical protein